MTDDLNDDDDAWDDVLEELYSSNASGLQRRADASPALAERLKELDKLLSVTELPGWSSFSDGSSRELEARQADLWERIARGLEGDASALPLYGAWARLLSMARFDLEDALTLRVVRGTRLLINRPADAQVVQRFATKSGFAADAVRSPDPTPIRLEPPLRPGDKLGLTFVMPVRGAPIVLLRVGPQTSLLYPSSSEQVREVSVGQKVFLTDTIRGNPGDEHELDFIVIPSSLAANVVGLSGDALLDRLASGARLSLRRYLYRLDK